MKFPENISAETFADGCVHFVGVVASLVAMPVLVLIAYQNLPISSTGSVAVYGICAIAMFAFSAAYNLVERPQWKTFLRHCDHSAIFCHDRRNLHAICRCNYWWRLGRRVASNCLDPCNSRNYSKNFITSPF